MHYYFIKDQVETRDIVIEHCPTEEMLVGNLTKPLQGALFRKFREEIMNITDDLDMEKMGMYITGLNKGDTDHGCPQECVGGCDKAGSKNSAKECPDRGTYNGTYDAIILEKGEKSRAVRSYADITREDVKNPLGENRLIIY